MNAVDVCKLVYNNSITVGYRFKLEDNTYADTDEETFNVASMGYPIRVFRSLPVYIVGNDCKTQNEIDFNIDVKDISKNVDLVRSYIISVKEYRVIKKKVSAKDNDTAEYVGTREQGYVKYKISSPDVFIREFRGNHLSRDLLKFNIERYGLDEYTDYIINSIKEWELRNC